MTVERPHLSFPFRLVHPPTTDSEGIDGGDPSATNPDAVDAGTNVSAGPPDIYDGSSPIPIGGSATVAVVEQDTPEHIMSCATVIAVCPVGARDDRPEFGWAWPELDTPPLDTDKLKVALEQFEPRANYDVTQYTDLIDQATQHINVQMEIQSDGDDSD